MGSAVCMVFGLRHRDDRVVLEGECSASLMGKFVSPSSKPLNALPMYCGARSGAAPQINTVKQLELMN